MYFSFVHNFIENLILRSLAIIWYQSCDHTLPCSPLVTWGILAPAPLSRKVDTSTKLTANGSMVLFLVLPLPMVHRPALVPVSSRFYGADSGVAKALRPPFSHSSCHSLWCCQGPWSTIPTTAYGAIVLFLVLPCPWSTGQLYLLLSNGSMVLFPVLPMPLVHRPALDTCHFRWCCQCPWPTIGNFLENSLALTASLVRHGVHIFQVLPGPLAHHLGRTQLVSVRACVCIIFHAQFHTEEAWHYIYHRTLAEFLNADPKQCDPTHVTKKQYRPSCLQAGLQYSSFLVRRPQDRRRRGHWPPGHEEPGGHHEATRTRGF